MSLLRVNTVIVGAGQAGLALSYYLKQQKREHVVLERASKLHSAGISSVIWATGYKFDFSLVKLPVVDADGYPLQKRGVASYEGLYFLGLPWLHSRKSGILFGVGDDAAYLAERIAERDRIMSALVA